MSGLPAVLGLDGKTYPGSVSGEERIWLRGRVHYLRHAESLSVRQIAARLQDEHGVRRSVGWVHDALQRPCTHCVQVSRKGTPEHLPAGGER
ncbi:predicted protein [Streptomyces sp. SPB78]|uniref:hypothetical protein n=1 Tax=Streptomyces sp. (strain SPB78) TaxID=591157 RepID=UPI0001B56EAE|nr:hypothetical protein [Streptomyces sp. SPB78]EFL01622.1 predicted protein [Streptomyces sp. SPB78]